MKRRLFTVEEASQALPLVGRVLSDIVRTYADLSRRAEEYRNLRAEPLAGGDSGNLVSAAKQAMSVLSDEIDAYVAEMEEIGCEVKDLKNGTVDFLSEMDGREIYLCWQVDEPAVEHWHEVTDGFQGRRPLPVTVPED